MLDLSIPHFKVLLFELIPKFFDEKTYLMLSGLLGALAGTFRIRLVASPQLKIKGDSQ
jgi:hypothetical protein